MYWPMRPKMIVTIFLLCYCTLSIAQDPAMDKLLSRYNSGSVPYISVEMLKMNYDSFVILDTRTKKEFEGSHLPNAIWVGDSFDRETVDQALARTGQSLPKDSNIVVYCSVGVRSEDYGEDLMKAGYANVFNLYGSIFAWKDAGYEVLDMQGWPTDRVHVYSQHWAKYLHTGEPVF